MCDKCEGELYQRDDDTEATVRNRLDVYNKQTAPLLEYYGDQGVLVRIDGDQDPEKVFAEIVVAVGGADPA